MKSSSVRTAAAARFRATSSILAAISSFSKARANFCLALRTGFTLSNSEMAYISPRIMDAYKNSCR